MFDFVSWDQGCKWLSKAKEVRKTKIQMKKKFYKSGNHEQSSRHV
jgi:hypothetical protein